jgi:tight adherence protein B
VNYYITTLSFSAGGLLVFGINLWIADLMMAHRRQVRQRLEEELQSRQKERARHSMANKDLYERAATGEVELRVRLTPRERFVRMVDESGMAVRPAPLAALAAMVGLAAAAATTVFGGTWILASLVCPLAGAVPVLYVAWVGKRRREKLLSQLPDAFDLMTRTLRAGQTMAQAFQAVSEEFGAPIANEFGYCLDQQNLGLSPEAAMRDLARRTGLLELRIFVLAVMIHRQTGGNFADLLHRLGMVIRERYRIRGAIKSLTAEGRLQAIILLALPPVMLGIMLALNRPYALTLFRYPSLLIGMSVSMALGGLWLRKIVRFDF